MSIPAVDDDLNPGEEVRYNGLPFTVLYEDGPGTYSLRWAKGGAHAPGVLRRLITRVGDKKCT